MSITTLQGQQITYYLTIKGEPLPNNVPYFIRFQWEDDKIRLRGLVDVATRKFHQVSVYVHLPSPKALQAQGSGETPFSIPRSKDDDAWTLVFSESVERPGIYLRPGNWERYFSELIHDVKKAQEELRKLNEIPIDDSSLFGDGDV